MQLTHVSTTVEGKGVSNRMTALAWSPNGKRMAVVGVDRIVTIYDETGTRVDKFNTKPAAKGGPKTYVVREMAWSPDSTKLAVAQSDNVVFVYLFADNEKKIVNKFEQSKSVTALAWPLEHPNEVAFGLEDGKVKCGSLTSNKATSLYEEENSYTISMCVSPDGHSILSGHLNGAINLFTFKHDNFDIIQRRICVHSCVPSALAWGEHIFACGEDRILAFYDQNSGRAEQTINDFRNKAASPINVATMNPAGNTLVCGAFNALRVFTYNGRLNKWDEGSALSVPNLYTVSAAVWSGDGSRLALTNFYGQVDVFEAVLRRSVHNRIFELTHVSASQVIVKRLTNPELPSILLKSTTNDEITKVNIYKNRYVVAYTPQTLLLADLDNYLLSEVNWSTHGAEKFFFEQPNVACIYSAGQLFFIEYGKNEILGICRTDHPNPHLNSVRVWENPATKVVLKRCAYLVDPRVAQVTDLHSGVALVTLEHAAKIDWLELNRHGTYVLFRDKRRHLYLVNVATAARSLLLDFCSYVQWVPNSDVIVAQNRGKLCVWYSIDSPEQVSSFGVKGEVANIVRGSGKTEVMVNEGTRLKAYTLDEKLIEFGAAMDDRDYTRALSMLETVAPSPETEAMWAALFALALEDNHLHMAERAAAALGDVSRAHYLRLVRHSARVQEQALGIEDGTKHYSVRASLAVFHRRFREAELIFLEKGAVDECMQMYQKVHKFDDADRVATANNIPNLAAYKAEYLNWLVSTTQFEKAAQVKEREGDYLTAINLYLKGNLPARAAQLVTAFSLQVPPDVLERIAATLVQAKMYSRAGDFFEKLGYVERAYEAYRKGSDFKRAVALARTAYPNQMTQLEEEWGDYLVTQKQFAAAIFHYGNVGKLEKALNAALLARQFNTALDILKVLDPSVAHRYYSKLAVQFEAAHNFSAAEQLYVMGGQAAAAVEMYSKFNRWQDIERLVGLLAPEEATRIFVSQADRLVAKGKLKDAERLYTSARLPDLAIAMYRKAGLYDDVMRLVATYDKGNHGAHSLELAKVLEADGKYKDAEKYYVAAGNWKAAIDMYRTHNKWEDAYRVAQSSGGAGAAEQVAFYWCRTGDVSPALMAKFGLVEPAVKHAILLEDYESAYALATAAAAPLLPKIHLKHALKLEDNAQFEEAEQHFVAAGRPREAVDMYIHYHDWENAARVARAHDPDAMAQVQLGQAEAFVKDGEWQKAEGVLLRIGKASVAVAMYKNQGMWDDALRVCKKHDPNNLASLQAERERSISQGAKANKDDLLQVGKMWVEQGDYNRAIDAYLKITAETTNDYNWLEEVWENVVQLTVQYARERLPAVVSTVSSRLMSIRRLEAAAEMYAGVDMFKEAIDVYLQANMVAAAEELARTRAPAFIDYVEGNRVQGLVEAGDAGELEARGHTLKALDAYARRGEWKRCLELAAAQSPAVLNQYQTLYCEDLANQGDFVAAVRVYSRFAPAPSVNNFTLYKRIVREIFYRRECDAFYELRSMLFPLYTSLRSQNVQDPEVSDFERYLVIAHLFFLKGVCAENRLLELEAKLAVSLCRYAGDIPADRTFYQAGEACKAVGWDVMDFIMKERFVDLEDVIMKASSEVHNRYFDKTDVPFDVVLPDEPFVSPSELEAVRDSVLQKTLESSTTFSLPTRPCDNCRTPIYGASLWCYSCSQTYVPCIVTGYPVLAAKRVTCKSCNMAANSDDWTNWIVKFKKCPWCQSPQGLSY